MAGAGPRSIPSGYDDGGHVSTRLRADACHACAPFVSGRLRPASRATLVDRAWSCRQFLIAENVREVQGVHQGGGAAAAGLLQERVDQVLGAVLRQRLHRFGDTDL